MKRTYQPKKIQRAKEHGFRKRIPPKPKVNVGLAVILCIFYLIPGLIYIAVKNNEKRKRQSCISW